MAVKDSDQEFVQNAYLTYLVPFATDFGLEQALKEFGEPKTSFFESIKDRESLFFGWCPSFTVCTSPGLLMCRC